MKSNSYNRKYFQERDYLDPKIASAVENLASEKRLKTVLDVGCGTGKLVEYLKSYKFSAHGSDPYANIQNKKNYFKSFATKLPFKDNSLDLVTSISVIEHLKKSEAAKFLEESHRVLKPGAYIFLVTPNFNSVWRIILGKRWFGYSDPTHINFYTPDSLSSLLKKYGFNNIKFSFKTNNLSFINYLLVSTPFWRIRDSFYVSGQNEKT